MKYAKLFKEELGITFSPQDELSSLVKGMHFALLNFKDECYTYRKIENIDKDTNNNNDNNDNNNNSEQHHKSSISDSTESNNNNIYRLQSESSEKEAERMNSSRWSRDIKELSVKVTVNPFDPSSSSSATSSKVLNTCRQTSSTSSNQFPSRIYNNNTNSGSNNNNNNNGSSSAQLSQQSNTTMNDSQHQPSISQMNVTKNQISPYLVVNVGSGVSILKVSSPVSFERVSGSSIGGGTYWGLSRLLTHCSSYEEVIDLAEKGNASEIDMLVKDIYGGSCK